MIRIARGAVVVLVLLGFVAGLATGLLATFPYPEIMP